MTHQRPTSLALAALAAVALPMAAQSAPARSWYAVRQASNPLVQWQHFGPGLSGYLDMFWIHDTDPDAMFMDLDMGNAHGTWDRGERWRSIKDSDGDDRTLQSITYIAFSHQDPDFGLLLAKDGIYATHNRGRRWEFLTDADPDSAAKYNVLTVDPNDDRLWYIGAGQQWQIKHTHFNQKGLLRSSDRHHAAGFLLKSTDRGRSWTRITSTFPPDTDFSEIIVDPRDSNTVYASCQDGVYRSTDAGLNWAKVAGRGLPYQQPRDMASYWDPATGEFWLYIVEVTHYLPKGATVACDGGVYRSQDGGETWDNLTGNLAIDLNAVNCWPYREWYYRAVAYWLELTPAEAKQEYPELPDRIFSQFIRIEVDPTDKDRIYLVHNFKHDYSFPPGNIWLTEDGGASWIAAAREGPYWATETDREYWLSRGNPLGVNTTFSHVAKEHIDRDDVQTGPRFVQVNSLGEVYTAFAQQLMRSVDHGRTWDQIDDVETAPGSCHWVGRGDSNLPGETLCVETGTPGVYLYGSGEHGLWRNTTDGDRVYPGAIAVEQLAGQSTSYDDALSIASIAVHPHDPRRIYTLQFRQQRKGELRYSPDGGASWQTLSKPLAFKRPNDVIKQYSLLIDPDQPDNLYFCVPRSAIAFWAPTQWTRNGPADFTDYGVYRSRDGGQSWTMANDGLPSGKSVHRLALDPADPAVLYAALNQTHTKEPGGLYTSLDHGANWVAAPLPEGILSVNKVAFSNANGDLFIACGTYLDDGSTGGLWVRHRGETEWRLLLDLPNVRGVAPSPVDPAVIAVVVGQSKSREFVNPGIYVTLDGGDAWHKINTNLGQPARALELAADPYDVNVLWCSLQGTGFWKADLGALANEPRATE